MYRFLARIISSLIFIIGISSCGSTFKMIDLEKRTFFDNLIFLSSSMLGTSYHIKFENGVYTKFVNSSYCSLGELFDVEIGHYKVKRDTLILAPQLIKCTNLGLIRNGKNLILPYNKTFDVCNGYMVDIDTLINVMYMSEIFVTEKIRLNKNDRGKLEFVMNHSRLTEIPKS